MNEPIEGPHYWVEAKVSCSRAIAPILESWWSELEGRFPTLFASIGDVEWVDVPSEEWEIDHSRGNPITLPVSKVCDVLAEINYHFNWLGLIVSDQPVMTEPIRVDCNRDLFRTPITPQWAASKVEVYVFDGCSIFAITSDLGLSERLRTLAEPLSDRIQDHH